MKKVIGSLIIIAALAVSAVAAIWVYSFKTLDIPVSITTPATNDDGTPLVDLLALDVYVKYSGDADWRFVMTIPETRAGITLDSVVTVPKQGIFELAMKARDDVGNTSDYSPSSVVVKSKTARPSPGKIDVRTP